MPAATIKRLEHAVEQALGSRQSARASSRPTAGRSKLMEMAIIQIAVRATTQRPSRRVGPPEATTAASSGSRLPSSAPVPSWSRPHSCPPAHRVPGPYSNYRAASA
ncbi:hypothetical protein FA95DRAFT_1561228 [Auriscalpium vulgare]|uniref:Uncharacterized protein n=1 Tax=Auriscalpium vulgare TaxID=40419 RepID=A0ACB8RMY5_9AGAM|nr:hypothetical protein FA95DRAFT_1561228 [Auriscalpium vulgare]